MCGKAIDEEIRMDLLSERSDSQHRPVLMLRIWLQRVRGGLCRWIDNFPTTRRIESDLSSGKELQESCRRTLSKRLLFAHGFLQSGASSPKFEWMVIGNALDFVLEEESLDVDGVAERRFVLELEATSSDKELEEHYDRAMKCGEMIDAEQVWVIHAPVRISTSCLIRGGVSSQPSKPLPSTRRRV